MLNRKAAPSRFAARQKTQRPQSFTAMMKCVLLALPFTVLLGALVLCTLTAILLLTPNPIHYATVPAILTLYLTAALGGVLATRIYGRRAPILCGLTTGLLLMLCLGIPSLFLTQSAGNAAATLLMRLLIPVASLAGALIAARKRKTRRSHVRKR